MVQVHGEKWEKDKKTATEKSDDETVGFAVTLVGFREWVNGYTQGPVFSLCLLKMIYGERQ